ncbi:hypothetical protein BSPWISOXPB_2852 [uncultured Gammaproteobacteria bacterium]|nr:hypothetical protein BSPWISOXPB_2852 [uncultured Gammaproteobacteria bacterium]
MNLVWVFKEIASDIEENLGTQAIKVKLEKVHRFVQSRIENPFVSSLIDKMYKNKTVQILTKNWKC